MTRRQVLRALGISSLPLIAGCGNNNDPTGTEREGVDTLQTDTAYPVGEATEPEDAPTPEDTPEGDDVFENMTPYEQVVKDMRDRIDVNENVRRDVQSMFSDGDEIEALEETMQHGATQAGFSSPAYYDSEKEYKTSGAIQAVARAVELYGEEDPDNTQEALGLHRINVDVKRVLLDGQEADVAIVEDTKADETALATNINLAPRTEGPNADAYRVGTEARGTTQELLKALTEPEDPGGGSLYDLDIIRGVTEGDIDTPTNAKNASKSWPDLEAGANTSSDKIWQPSGFVPQRVMITMDYFREISEHGHFGMKYVCEHTEVVQQASPAEDETIVVGLGQDGLEIQTVNYDYSRGFVENLSQL